VSERKRHVGPAPSERQLFRLWDAIEAERSRAGERAALALATKALQAVQPPKEQARPDKGTSNE
jgi:hypothetical protein